MTSLTGYWARRAEAWNLFWNIRVSTKRSMLSGKSDLLNPGDLVVLGGPQAHWRFLN